MEIDPEELTKIMVEIAKKYEEWREERENNILKHINKEELEKISKEELILVLYEVLQQACEYEDGTADSLALSAYASGLRLLARLGLFEIESEYGRRVIGRFKV